MQGVGLEAARGAELLGEGEGEEHVCRLGLAVAGPLVVRLASLQIKTKKADLSLGQRVSLLLFLYISCAFEK